MVSFPRITRRRKRQFLVVAAIYVAASIGLMHPMFQTYVRELQMQDAPYFAGQMEPSQSTGWVHKFLLGLVKATSRAKVNKRQRIQWEREHSKEEAEKWEGNPIFVMNLPGTGTQTAYRYFKCAFGDTRDVAMYWAKEEEGRNNKHNTNQEIGRCFQSNLLQGNSPLQNCGKPKVWSSMGYSQHYNSQCFYPSMDIRALHALANEYPQATVVQILQDPHQWYESSYPRLRENLATLCRQEHSNAPIPARNGTRQDWVAFYQWHESFVRDFAVHHPTLNYVEVLMNSTRSGMILKDKLGLPHLCWRPPKRVVNRLEKAKRQREDVRQRDLELTVKPPPEKQLTYPIFVASLPKSGTTSTQRFFQCGLGFHSAAHHQGYNETSDQTFKIGKVMERNIQQNRSIFEDCGDFDVWTDVGYLEDPSKENRGKPLQCFFPTMHGGLEAFYQSYPNGTILNVLRDPIQWYESAIQWRRLPERLSRCGRGFPPPKSSPSVWVEFYQWHTQLIRDFAAEHPSLTYLEVSLEAAETGKILQDHTNIPEVCWGDCNPDGLKKQCRVFQKKREYEIEQHRKKRKENKFVATKAKKGALISRAARNSLLRDPKWEAIHQKFQTYKDRPVEVVHGNIAALHR